jgi:hypothetical protein
MVPGELMPEPNMQPTLNESQWAKNPRITAAEQAREIVTPDDAANIEREIANDPMEGEKTDGK